MATHQLQLSPNVTVERVGRDVVVLIGGLREVVVLSARQAHVVDHITQGMDLDADLGQEVSALIEAGVLTGKTLPTRRGFLGATAAGVGAGLLSLSMPVAAVASSPMVLSGVWANYGGTARFAARYYERLAGDPDVLTVPDGSATFTRFRDNYGSPDVDYVIWNQGVMNSSPGAIQGTFSWAGVFFTANFTNDLSLISDILD